MVTYVHSVRYIRYAYMKSELWYFWCNEIALAMQGCSIGRLALANIEPGLFPVINKLLLAHMSLPACMYITIVKTTTTTTTTTAKQELSCLDLQVVSVFYQPCMLPVCYVPSLVLLINTLTLALNQTAIAQKSQRYSNPSMALPTLGN